jgi:hypothetical protein
MRSLSAVQLGRERRPDVTRREHTRVRDPSRRGEQRPSKEKPSRGPFHNGPAPPCGACARLATPTSAVKVRAKRAAFTAQRGACGHSCPVSEANIRAGSNSETAKQSSCLSPVRTLAARPASSSPPPNTAHFPMESRTHPAGPSSLSGLRHRRTSSRTRLGIDPHP